MQSRDPLKLIRTRDSHLVPLGIPGSKIEAEGGCGVIGFASAEKVAGRHLMKPLQQMCNRGNGKGGGIAASGLDPKVFGITQEILDGDYLIAIAYLDRGCRLKLEEEFIQPIFEVDHIHEIAHLPDFRSIHGLMVEPPLVLTYFVKVKNSVLCEFKAKNDLLTFSDAACEEELVYQNSYRLNRAFYAAEGEKRAFVLSHGKNLLVLKMVGYGDEVIRYYQLENFAAHVWIGHHRYPTKGRVWHPGGAHPFVGLSEALVHNGDFANYFSMTEYLAQKGIHPLFLTDTEVAVLLFDLLYRTYRYPLEYVIEALAPTTERDFTMLSKEKREIYALLQKMHMHGSPDGPWFFLIAQSLWNDPKKPAQRLIGITDTSMLRPQVFALQKGSVPIGFAASEKQAIDAVLKSLASEDSRFWGEADYYWNARGGSYTDGGVFVFTVEKEINGDTVLKCTDKFGKNIHVESLHPPYDPTKDLRPTMMEIPELSAFELYGWVRKQIASWDYKEIQGFLAALHHSAQDDQSLKRALEVLTRLIDMHLPVGQMRRSSLKALFYECFVQVCQSFIDDPTPSFAYLRVEGVRVYPKDDQQILLIDASGFPSQGEGSLADSVVKMYRLGFKKFIIFNCEGQRFLGNGFGASSEGVEIDVYGSSGDYLASGIDGAVMRVHGNAQDQLAQIMKEGKLIVYGDVGQAFMYGAKGGKAFVRGNTAGRPLINAVGSPKVVINGTCLDYLAESFMAGNPLKGGGFVIVNAIGFAENGNIVELPSAYPGSNLFSLASGGAIYIRDPEFQISADQLNGGDFAEMTTSDWQLILPLLEENAHYFDIPLHRLLEYKGRTLPFDQVYRKIAPAHFHVLMEEEAWVKGQS